LTFFRPSRLLQKLTCALFSKSKKIGLDAADQMSYSRPLTDTTTNPRGWVCIWDFRDDGNSADREASPLARMRAARFGHFDQRPARRPARKRGRQESRSVQSLPEQCRVLCPPGTQLFRGPFFARRARPKVVVAQPPSAV
jgi:hypothetical protein